ncbi:PREDICTED: glycoprotein-N-acetylgalactosamine 3-beta-galactosyltransferase 1-like [Drosophila arizonae]|uniref:Glycoprotein-N-acetylgalactosamine 3-beta-galactosyltransferase 1-like n=1 Tax=Drosophila arizonae TaxID=7263 RepID=A0ABM1Q0Q2_DROAR|nr:PREDICTED: glycoprotein-N-acetylgalactosamine 3-beta-galactosyltransferase 1-like [Drosophila arizonae]
MIYYDTDEGLDGCSNYTISFHYIKPNQMYVLDYLIYQLRPYGIVHKPDALPKKLALGELMPAPQVPVESQVSTESKDSNTTETVTKAQ